MVGREDDVMVKLRIGSIPRVGVALVSSAMLVVGFGQPAHADVSAVSGSAYGYYGDVTIFGGRNTAGPTPTVTLAPDASNSPQTATAAFGRFDAGPAVLFSSGQIDVRTEGTIGANGSVTSSTDIQNVNASGQETFTATTLSSDCIASEAGASGSTTITGGTLQIDSGDDDPTNIIPDHPPVDVALPVNPAPTTVYDGHIHIGQTTDSFRYVFNEQVVGPDGSITVNAGHQYLIGPIAVGDVILGQSVCGVTGTGADLSIALADVPDPAPARGKVTYTVDVANAGPETATGVTVFTSIPKGTRFVSATGATCTALYGRESGISCDLGSIGAGDVAQFTMVVKVGGRPITVTSTVSSDVEDPDPSNNADVETTAIAP